MIPDLLIKKKALDAGFDLAGIAPLDIWKDLDFARRWVEQGYGGEMHYLANPKRSDPRQVLPSAQSVICVGLIYNAPLPYSTEVRSQESEISEDKSSCGWISRYGWGHDYHKLMRVKLEALRRDIEALGDGIETRVYVDTGPVAERAFARYSGIGWTGKNTCLINAEKGSWFFLGVILTSLALDPDSPAPDRCGSCTRCLDACPTGALVEPYVMDASRCIAYFTIELKGSIPEQYRPAIGANVFGCDICQDVCPWNAGSRITDQGLGIRSQGNAISFQPSAISNNKAEMPESKGCGRIGAATTLAPEFQPLNFHISPGSFPAGEGASRSEAGEGEFSLFNPPLESLAAIGEDDFRRIFARSPVKRPKFRGWLRNLCVVIGNSDNQKFLPWLERLANDPDDMIREHASWAIDRLRTRL